MFKKFILRISRPLGIFLIFTFSAYCIFLSLVLRDVKTDTLLGQIATYAVSFENRFYDFRMKDLIDPKAQSREQVLVKIDDYSLDRIGTFPFPRKVYADFINKAKGYGAKIIGMDVMFPEKSQSCGTETPDGLLIEAFKDFKKDGRSIFISYTLTEDPSASVKEFPDDLLNWMPLSRSIGSGFMKPQYVDKYTFPIDEFNQSGVGLGFINSQQDPDGVFRSYRLVANVDSLYPGSLAINIYDAFTKTEEKSLIVIQENGEGSLHIGNRTAEVNSDGEIKIRWLGSLPQFKSVSLFDVLNAPADDPAMVKLMKDKIIFLGSTAVGAHDLRPTPVDGTMPGVLNHMNAIHMMIHKYFLKDTDLSVQYSMFLLLLGSLIFWVASRLGYASVDLITLALMIGASYYADKFYFLPEGYELKLFYCYFGFIASYSWNTFLNFSEANKEKKQVRRTFARYVAPSIVDEMLKDPEKLVVGGFRRDITCLFSDVRDFTSISERLSPTELAHSLNMYMGKMTDIVFDTKGTLDKYIGDAIVAFWGAPLEIGNHAQYAVEAALKMMDALPKINEEFRKLNRPEFHVGIGLNSGECNVGNMGSSRIFSYTALGDNMNLGARLEGLCKYYGTQILISEYTLARIDTSKMKIRPIDNVIVKGKTTPVAVFEVIHSHHFMTITPSAHELYIKSHRHFLKREFQRALEGFEQVLSIKADDKASKRFHDLCLIYSGNPELADENFSVTVMTEK